MTNVYAWPPVGLTGWEITHQDPVSVSRGLFQGAPRTSSYLARRRLATAIVPFVGLEQANSGYVEMLKDYLAGVHLVRVECHSAIWHVARSNLQNALGEWLTGGVGGTWLSGIVPGYWVTHAGYGTAGTVDGFPAITVTGLPASQIVVRPHELVTLLDPGGNQSARAVRVARSDASGNAVIRLNAAMTGEGPVSIGDTESIVFRPLSYPRAVQSVGGGGTYQWDFEEAFEAEHPGGWTEVDPWA